MTQQISNLFYFRKACSIFNYIENRFEKKCMEILLNCFQNYI